MCSLGSLFFLNELSQLVDAIWTACLDWHLCGCNKFLWSQNFLSGLKTMTYQKERVTEFDEFVHRIGLEVIEGGHLNHGFSHYKTTFQLTSTGEQETLIDVTISYESQVEEDTIPSNSASSTLVFIKHMENYLMNGAT